MNQENNNNGIDFNKRLNESASKSQNGQRSSGPLVSPTTPKITRWLIKYSGGLIKNERQASYVILGFIILTIVISIFLFSGGGGGGDQKIFTPPSTTGGP
jgi:hypothetical protein